MVMSPADRERLGIDPVRSEDAKPTKKTKQKAASRAPKKSTTTTAKAKTGAASKTRKAAPKTRKPSPKKPTAQNQNLGEQPVTSGFQHISFQIVAGHAEHKDRAFSIHECNFGQILQKRSTNTIFSANHNLLEALEEMNATADKIAVFSPKQRALILNLTGENSRRSYAQWITENVYPRSRFEKIIGKTCIIDDFALWAGASAVLGADERARMQDVAWSLLDLFTWLHEGHLEAKIPEVTYRIHVGDDADRDLVAKLASWFENDFKQQLDIPYSVDVVEDEQTDAFTARTNLESDQASANDFLGFRPLAKSLGAFVKHRKTGLPLSIAIDGPWGTGKSSLMLMLQEQLEKGSSDAGAERSKPTALQTGWQAIQLFYYTLEPFLLLLGMGAFILSVAVYAGFTAFAQGTEAPWVWPVLLASFLYMATVALFWRKRRASNSARKEAAVREFDTVFVNAWRHGHGTRLKAAIMKRIIDKLIAKRGPRFFLRLQLARFNRFSFLGTVFRTGIQNSVVLAALFLAGILVFFQIDFWPFSLLSLPEAGTNALGAAMAAGSVALKFTKKSNAANMKDFLTSPDYEKLAGPDDEIEEDFERIIALLEEEGRSLAIFIDDLDRCSPETVHRVVEALNVFFGKQHSECLFILGMHKELVATSLEVAYEKMAKKLEGNPLLKEQLPYGRRFLEKIVQFAVSVPRPRASDIEGYVAQLTLGSVSHRAEALAEQVHQLGTADAATKTQQDMHSSAKESVRSLKPEQKEAYDKKIEALEKEELRLKDAAGFTPTDTNVAAIFAEVRPALRSNPRQYKRFFNQFRFNRFVSESLGDLPSITAERNDAIIAVLALEYPLLFQWAFDDLVVKEGQRRIEAALEKTLQLCANGANIKEVLEEGADTELRIRHTYHYDTQLKTLLERVVLSAEGEEKTVPEAAE